MKYPLTLKELQSKYWELINQEIVCISLDQAELYDTSEITRELNELEERIRKHPEYKVAETEIGGI